MGREWKGHRLLIDCKYNKATKSPSATKSYALLDLLILALSTGDATPLLDLALLNELDVGDAIPSLTILLDFALDNNVSITCFICALGRFAERLTLTGLCAKKCISCG